KNQTVTLHNTAGVTRTFTATSKDPSIEITGSSAGPIPPGGVLSFSVAAQPVAATQKPGYTARTLLEIAIDDPARSKVSVPVVVTAHGAQLVVSGADFGYVPQNTQAVDQPLSVVNRGNATVSFTVGPLLNPGVFGFTYPGQPAVVTL